MGPCHGSCHCISNDEAVDLRLAPQSRERWTRKVGHVSPLVREMLFSDGKVLADFIVFLCDMELSQVVRVWQLSTARFALHGSGQVRSACARLAAQLGSSWIQYLESPQGYGNFKDLKEWHRLVQHQQDARQAQRVSRTTTLDLAPELPIGNLVNEEHSRYIFAVAAMFGIHVATICHRICENAVALALQERPFREVFHSTFPKLRYDECLQCSCFTYRIPPEGSAYSPSTEVLTGGKLAVPYFIDDFCPQLFGQVRQLCGVSNDEYFRSICRPDVEFVEFVTTSKSGEFFFFSHDGRFMLKTAKRYEAETLLRMLPDMIDRFQSSPHSLLGRYVGLYRIHGEQIDCDVLFFVMLAVTQHPHSIHYTYDLKGCLGKHRKAKETESGKKDLDFLDDFGDLRLSPDDADLLLQVHGEDVELLRQHTIMDYSILLQVYDQNAVGVDDAPPTVSFNAARFATMSSGPTRLGTLQASGNAHWASQLPQGDAAQLLWHSSRPGHADQTVPQWRPNRGLRSADGRYVYTMGLIDLLVPWTWRTKVEVGYYEVVSCGKGHTYSRQSPSSYAERQIELMERMCGIVTEGEDDEVSSAESGED
mmetsp:Transcript_455/g.1143  ORF Transcript_455/g.1143 Transcript_455/m.1143 type:complete len:593 (+) Transcript_455:38-1816(+)